MVRGLSWSQLLGPDRTLQHRWVRRGPDLHCNYQSQKLSLLWAAMQITWFAGSTTVSVANGGSCYPECCAEAPNASTHTGRLRCLDPVFSPTTFSPSALRDCSLVAQGRLLQTPSGVQEVTPSTQQMLPASFSTARAFVLHHQMAVQTAIPSMQYRF